MWRTMLDPTTVALSSAIAVLAAVDTPLPVNVTAMVLLAIVLRYMLKRDDTAHVQHAERLDELENEVREVRQEASDQRHRAHQLENHITGQIAALAMLVPAAEQCSCGIMAPYVPVLHRLTAPRETT